MLLTFAELEQLLGRSLPASARPHRPWWGNHEGSPQARAWLGLCAVAPEIRTSGLWNVNHVDEPYDPGFLEILGRHIATLEGTGR